MPINGNAAAIGATGALFLWSGIRGIGVLASVQDLIQGHGPSTVQANPIAQTGGGGGGGDGGGFLATNNQVATTAEQYQGQGYVWGGNGSRPGDWDCSSFFSYVINHDLGVPIPGFAAHEFGSGGHGPTVAQYLIWSGAATVVQAHAQPGDYICFGVSHMGIYLGNGQMISAENPSLGTVVSSVAAQNQGLTVYRRLR
jgi:hypothetical protein